ncbi:nucleotide exchange factor GrpE [Fusicatenibacter sp.]
MEKYTRTETPNGVFGIYMDTDIIHVRILTGGKSQPVLSMPAYFNLDDLDDVLTGRRAVVQANMNPKKALHSVLAFMQEAESAVSSTLEPCSIRYCIALMKELKMELQKTAFAQISDCVLALSVPEIITQKNVRIAMEKAGFHVIRVMTATDACALSKAQDMKHDQQFGVRVISNCKKQNLLAEFSAWTDQTNMLEGLEYTIGENTPEMIPNMTYYYLSDTKSRETLGQETIGYEDLSVVAADGAAAQGARLTNPAANPITMLVLFPWTAGIEITTIQWGKECIPLTWLNEERHMIPMRTDGFDILLDSGIKGKSLNLYLKSKDSKREVRTWKMEEICPEFPKDTSQLKAWIEVGMEGGDFTLVLQSGEKRAKIDLSQFTEEKPEPFPINTVFVPKQLLANVLQAGKEFCLGAENLNPTTKASAIGKGIQMIARQTQEVFADCHDGDTNIRVSTWIEKLLAVKDNLEYGIVSSERTTNRWAYMDEKLLMMDFRTALAQNLYQLNVLPIEANGAIFDPHIHDAVHIEETDRVEEDRVVEEIQKGYFFGEKLYRPTKVIVSKNSCQK